jgi:integrase
MNETTIYTRKGKKGITIYTSTPNGTTIPDRKSTKITIPIREWDYKKNWVKNTYPNKLQFEKEINEILNKNRAQFKGVFFGDESIDFIAFMDKRINESQSVREISKWKYRTYRNNIVWVIKHELKRKNLPISELRNQEILKKIKLGLRINRKNPNKLKSDTTFVDSVKAFAREIGYWNSMSETQYPINTNILLTDLPKKSSKPAITISQEQVIQFSQITGLRPAQKLSKNIFMFQYLSGGLRIYDVLLLTNKSFQAEYLVVQVMKNRVPLKIPYTIELLTLLDLKYETELKDSFEQFNFSKITLTGELMKQLIPVIKNWMYEVRGFKDFQKHLNLSLVDCKKSKPKLNALMELSSIAERQIIENFVSKINKLKEDFVFPRLKMIDFESVMGDTTKFTPRHNQIAHNARQCHLNAIKRICEKYGFPKLSGHSPRHSYAHQLCKDGYSTKEIQEVLAHKNEKTTLVYMNSRHPKTSSTRTLTEVNGRFKILKAQMG